MVSNVEVYVNKDRRVTIQEIANKFNIGKILITSFVFLSQKKGMSKISARWVAKHLKEDQRQPG